MRDNGAHCLCVCVWVCVFVWKFELRNFKQNVPFLGSLILYLHSLSIQLLTEVHIVVHAYKLFLCIIF